jgi:hypothetical protein
MYNDTERCDNHIDFHTTLGFLEEIFKGILYGYYYEYLQGEDKPNLKFTLYFVTPFDNVYAHKYGDCNGFYKEDINGFKNEVLKEKSTGLKNMQVVPLQYDDYYGNYEKAGFPKTRPTFMEAVKTNIYKDERDRGFFERYFNKPKSSPWQIKEVLDHNMFYKVTFEVPFDAIADYVRVDKILIEGDTEKTKPLYEPPDRNAVDGLAKRLNRARSVVNEMDLLIKEIQSDPIKFKKDNKEFDWAEECRTKGGLNLEAAVFLMNKVKADFEKMESVLYGAMTWDIRREPVDIEDKKCSHDLCIREREKGSKFCNACIQLSTKECNYCKKA